MRPSSGTNLPQTGTHSCQKAILKHALERVCRMNTSILVLQLTGKTFVEKTKDEEIEIKQNFINK